MLGALAVVVPVDWGAVAPAEPVGPGLAEGLGLVLVSRVLALEIRPTLPPGVTRRATQAIRGASP
jgi:hypothetical protein